MLLPAKSDEMKSNEKHEIFAHELKKCIEVGGGIFERLL
jgi:hypothetical protein